jgi:hypothetical protein
MSNFESVPSDGAPTFQSAENLLGNDAAAMDMYRRLGFCVETEVVPRTTEVDSSTLPYLAEMPGQRICRGARFLLASLDPSAPIPEYLSSMPMLVFRQIRSNVLYDIGLRARRDKIAHVVFSTIEASGLVPVRILEVSKDETLKGKTRLGDGTLKDLSVKDTVEHIKLAASHLDEYRALMKKGFFEIHHPFEQN